MVNYDPAIARSLLRERFGEQFSDHQTLAQVMPAGLGGVCNFFVEALTTADLVDATKLATKHKLPYRVVGAGTATLAGEAGYPGLVIKNSTSNIFRLDRSSKVVCDSGVSNLLLVNKMASNGLGGLEFLVTIPGTLGGAVVTEAGSLGSWIKSYVREISIFDPDIESIRNVGIDWLQTAGTSKYFSSELAFPPVLLTVTLQLAELSQQEIIRRLSQVKRRSSSFPNRIFGHLFSETLLQIEITGGSKKQLRDLGVSYNQERDWLELKKTAQPSQVRQAIEVLSGLAKEHGLNPTPRLTYLGYFNEQTDD